MPVRREKLIALAQRHDLLIGGGSDWHGHHPEPPLGTWRPPADRLVGLVDACTG
jgi:hypothetical protein